MQGCKKSLHGFCKHLPGVHQLRTLILREREERGGGEEKERRREEREGEEIEGRKGP